MARHRVVAAAFVLLLSSAGMAPARAGDGCQPDDPIDEFNEGLRRANGEKIPDKGWGTYDFEKQMDLIPDDPAPGGQIDLSPDYSHLPTTFAAWYDSLRAGDRRQLFRALAAGSAIEGVEATDREIDAYIMLIVGDVDDMLTGGLLSASERQAAIAEIAIGAGLDPKRDTFGREGYGDPDGDWNNEDLGNPEGFGNPFETDITSDADPRFAEPED